MRTIKAMYEARLSDLRPGDFVKVECRCLHAELIPPVGLIHGMRLPPETLILDLKPRFRCRECDTKGALIVSVKWADD